MEAHEIIDNGTFTELKDLVGADFIIELIDTYTVETGELIEKLRQAMEAGEAATFGRLAHSIKSSSAGMGALNFSQQARELEMLGKGSNLTGAEPRVEQLEIDFLKVKRCLEDLKDEL